MRSCGMLEQVVSYIRLEIEELTQVWSDIVLDRIRLLDDELEYQLDS